MNNVIITAACDMNYFNIYFELWAKQFNKVYPDIEKIIYIYKPTKKALRLCKNLGIKAKSAELYNTDAPGAFYLLRWLNLPYKYKKNILSTQINCIPLKRLDDSVLNTEVDHLRLGYLKPFSKTGNHDGIDKVRLVQTKKGSIRRLAGITASIFNCSIAERIVAKARELSDKPPSSDHTISQWKEENFPCEIILAIQKANGPPYKAFTKSIKDYAFFAKAPSAAGGKITNESKLAILNSIVELYNRRS
mgnify:CR=1 FL=1